MRLFQKHGLLTFIACVGVAAYSSSYADATPLWATDDNGELYSLSTSSATLTPVGNTGQGLVADITFGPNDLLYGFSAGASPGLYTINPATAAATVIGPLGLSFAYEGALAFAPNGTLYGGNANNSTADTLFTINPSTGAASTIGTLSGTHDINGMVVRSDGMLVGLDDDGNSLLVINPTTLSYSTLAVLPFSVGNVGGMTMVGSTGYFATANSSGTDSLYSFDPFSGVYSPIGSFTPVPGNDGISGLAAMPVPEPATWALLLILTATLALARRASGAASS